MLGELGDFAKDDVMLLQDPAPAAVLAAVDGLVATLPSDARDALLIFYYSGHSDEDAIYPDGHALP